MNNNDEILSFIIDIVKEASLLINDNFTINQKGKYDDLVTNLDTEVERFLISKIKEKYFNFDIVSEEYNSNNSVTDNCFVIDPIDGTINFSNKKYRYFAEYSWTRICGPILRTARVVVQRSYDLS